MEETQRGTESSSTQAVASRRQSTRYSTVHTRVEEEIRRIVGGANKCSVDAVNGTGGLGNRACREGIASTGRSNKTKQTKTKHMSTAGHKNVYRCWNPINVGAGCVASAHQVVATSRLLSLTHLSRRIAT